MTLNPQELIDLNRQLEMLERLKKEHALAFFKPNAPQMRMFLSDATYRCLFGANKVGKSTCGIIEDISYCLGERKFLPKNHPHRKTPFAPPVKGMCFAETWDKADEVLTPHFEKWLPEGSAEAIRRQGRTVGWQFTNGSEIRYATYEMDPDRMEGADKHFYHFDEPPPYALWAPVARGIVVNGGRIWLTLTLLSEGWIWDEIWEKYEAGDEDYYATTGDIRDNLRREHSDGTVTGALTEEAIKRFEKTLDDTAREVRLHGKPQHLQGRIFKYFQVKKPWVTEEWDVPKDWPALRTFDPHLSKPVAVLWGRISPSGRLFITDELFDSSIRGLKHLKERIDTIEKRRSHKVKLSLMDSTFRQSDLVSGRSMMDVFADHGIRCSPAPKADKLARLIETAERFKLDEITSEPRIVVFKNCERLIWELKRYTFPSLRSRSPTEKYRDLPKGKDKKDDDLIDCLLYMVATNPTYKGLSYRMGPPIFGGRGSSVAMAQEYIDPYAKEYTGNAVQDQSY